MTSPFVPPSRGFLGLEGAWRWLAGKRSRPEQYELFDSELAPPQGDSNSDERLAELIELIKRHYVFSQDHYPELPLDAERRLRFGLRHSAMHFAKTAGQLAAVCEAFDHGEEPDFDALRALIPKALINTLKLAELINLGEADLLDAACRRYRHSA